MDNNMCKKFNDLSNQYMTCLLNDPFILIECNFTMEFTIVFIITNNHLPRPPRVVP